MLLLFLNSIFSFLTVLTVYIFVLPPLRPSVSIVTDTGVFSFSPIFLFENLDITILLFLLFLLLILVFSLVKEIISGFFILRAILLGSYLLMPSKDFFGLIDSGLYLISEDI